MEKMNLNILGTEEFISEVKCKIKEGLDSGESVENAVINALPEAFPKEFIFSIENTVNRYLKERD